MIELASLQGSPLSHYSSLGTSRASSPVVSQPSSHWDAPISPVPKFHTTDVEYNDNLHLLKRKFPTDISKLLCSSPLSSLQRWCTDSLVQTVGPLGHKTSYTLPLAEKFWNVYVSYSSLNSESLRRIGRAAGSRSIVRDGLVFDILQGLFPIDFLRKVLYVSKFNRKIAQRTTNAAMFDAKIDAAISELKSRTDSWPPQLDNAFLQQCSTEYVKATTITPPRPCACCGRAFLSNQLTSSFPFSFQDIIPEAHPLQLLRADKHLVSSFRAPPSLPSRLFDGLMIFHDHIKLDQLNHTVSLHLCHECDSALNSQRVPRFSLRNNLYRGRLPPDLNDLTWIEEKVCALHRVTADVAHLHHTERDESLPFRLVGNICVYPADKSAISFMNLIF
ncbi:hypothetical protein FRC20_007552 [Serendipita sp. 405]|nr:hypothetical protein FRC20_007552 [Serendipita sp. 405]